MIGDAMQRIGKIEVDVPAVRPSADEWRYRTKLTLALRRRSGQWIAGLHAYDDPSRVFALADCPITDRRVVGAWREVMAVAHLLPDAQDLRGSIRWTDDGPTFVLIGGRRWTSHEEFFAAVPTLAALYWEPLDRPRLTLVERRTSHIPAASFAQVNPVVASQLREHVYHRVLAYQPTRVVDAYSGNGDLSVSIAAHGINVTAIELDADAAAWAQTRLPESSRSVRARVEDALPMHLPADVVIVNPPRAGLHADVPAMLSGGQRPRVILYVSCDPATLARDIARLSGYTVSAITAFDMFPQTSHVETVCELIPEAA